jgi:tRNA (cytidine/uridine-2'-O-)-methyltransferase
MLLFKQMPTVKQPAKQSNYSGEFLAPTRESCNKASMIRLVLYEPDIPQNLGACMRLCACLGAQLHVIEPCGFALNNAKLKRVGMDYINRLELIKHASFQHFMDYKTNHPGQLLLLETDGTTIYSAHPFQAGDYIMLGRESVGTPQHLYKLMDKTLIIPMQQGLRSLNMAMSAGIVVAEAARQLRL